MNISCPRLENKIILESGRPFVLCIENPAEYFRVIGDFIAAFNGDESELTFWNEQEQVRADKVGEILTDLFTFELTDKKVINLLYKQLQKNYLDGSLILDFQKVKAEAEKFLIELCATADFALDYDELTVEALLKICSVRPLKNYETLIEKIICYINIFAELKGASCFVFVGLKSVLSDEDLQKLYRHCRLHKISLLIIESGNMRKLLAEERAIVITDDLCELVENFD